MKILKYSFPYIIKHPYQMILFILLNLAIWATAISLPYITGTFIDSLIRNDAIDHVFIFALIIFAVNVLNVIFQYLSDYINNNLQNKTGFKAKFKLFRMIKKFPMQYFKDKDVVYINQQINEDISQIFSFVFSNIVPIITNILTILLSVIILSTINFNLTIFLLLLIPVYIAIYFSFKTPLFKANYDMREERNFYQSFQTSQFINVKHIKTEAIFDEMDKALYNKFLKQFKKVMHFFHLGYFFSNIGSAVMLIANVIIVFYGGLKVIDQSITIGQFTIINTYFNMIIRTTSFFLSLGNEYQQALVSYDRLINIENIPIERNGKNYLSNIKSIKIENLVFAYDSKLIINKFNYNFEKGNTYVITGKNGIGKTTLINLIIGLYQEIKSGSIKYNDEKIENLDMYHIRHDMVSILEQDIILLGNTILEGLTIGIDGVTEEDVSYWCNLIGVSNVIENLPHHYHTNLNEHNVSFSGGEIQKLSLVRCFLKNPSVMILDEPTSAFDADSKIAFSNLINAYKKNRIIIIITHDVVFIEELESIIVNLHSIETSENY